jgi:RHS repeat-associated protein
MLAHTDPLGNMTTYSNDARGNVLETTLPYPAGADPVKYTTRYTYDTNDNQTSVVLPTGGVITNKFDPFGNLLETRDGAGNIIATNAYDANGFMIAEGDQFGALRFGHDAMGNATTMTNSLGQVITSGYDANGDITNLVDSGVTSSFTYDAQGRDRFANYGNGITLSNSYNSQLDWNSVDGPTIGHMERRFDNQGRLAGWTTVNGAQPGFAYNENGQMEYETNSIGVVTREVYDAAGRLISVTNLTTGASAGYGYDAAGQRIGETNALGHVTRFDYNPDGSLKSMTNAFGTNVWTYAYDTGAGCCGGNGGTTTSVTDPLGREVTDIRSPLGLPLQVITKLGTNAVTNTTVYLSGIVSPDQEGEEYPASITDEGGRTRNFGYTPLGQLERASDLSGIWYTNQHDSASGQLTNVLGPTGESLSYVYDNLGNVKATRFGDGNWLTNYYNAQNNVASNALPNGISIHHQYDGAGRLTNSISSMGEVASLAYNGNDAVSRMSDNTGGTTNLYDLAGRLIGIDHPTGATVRYELDKLDRITAITNRTSGFGAPYIVRYAYDAIGNITNITDPFGGHTTFQYDRTGRRTKRALPNGITTEWQYNWRDQITNMTHKNNGGTVLASVAYERAPFGEPTRITREDGSYVILNYDSALRLTNEQHYASGGLLETLGYGYDASGSRIRLSNANGVFTNSVLPGYRITAVKRQSDGATVETYGYDSGGRINSLNRPGVTLNFGHSTVDQLTAATNGANWTQYYHDATGRRTKAIDQAGAQRRFLIAPTPGTDLETTHLVGDASNNLKQGYIYLGDQPLLRFDNNGAASRVYYLEDAMGSVIGLAPNDSPALGNTTRLFYTGFGGARSTNGPAPTIPSGVVGDFRFHRAWWESATDLYHMRAREYDPHTGRFLSRDPRNGTFRRPETLQPYTYALNNPQIYRDPTGEFTVLEVSIVSAGQIADKIGRIIAGQLTKKQVRKQIGKIIRNELEKQVKALLPGYNLSPTFTGAEFGRTVRDAFREAICDELALPESIFVEVPITIDGLPLGNGFTCNEELKGEAFNKKLVELFKLGVPRPDFIIGSKPPKSEKGYPKTWLIGEFKGTTGILYRSYFKPATEINQYVATLNYAKKHTYTRTALFIVGMREKGKLNTLMKELMAKDALKYQVIPYIIIIVGR